MFRRLFLAAVVIAVPALTGGPAQSQAAKVKRLHGEGTIYFIPLHNFPKSTLQDLAAYYKKKYKLNVKIVPAVKLERSVADMQRRQLIAEEVVKLMRRKQSALAGNPHNILIALTKLDMYPRSEGWRYSFQSGEDNIAIISSARMDPTSYGARPNPALTKKRLRKMITKRIGAMYFHLPYSDDPHNVMYKSIMGLEDLDNVGEDL